MRNAVSVPAGPEECHMNVDWRVWVDFQALLRELVSVGDHGLFESHHSHQHRLPVVLVVLLFLILYDLFLL